MKWHGTRIVLVLVFLTMQSPAFLSASAAEIDSMSVVRPNFVIQGKGLSKVEIWAIPTGTEVQPESYQLLGLAKKTSTGTEQTWVLPIPPQSSGLLATDIFAKGFDRQGKEVGTKYLPIEGAGNLEHALWGVDNR